MGAIFQATVHALLMSAGMAWRTGWSLGLGFTVSATLQAVVSTEQLRRAFGRNGLKEIALATAAGAASSSCSYASAAIMRTLFKRGAAFIPSLAFLLSSTNLVLELGLILLVLMGWRFMAAEWIGGVVLVVVVSLLVRLSYPKRLVDEARRHEERGGGHEHMSMSVEGPNLLARLRRPEARIAIAQNFAMDWAMLWKDLAAGFLIAGALAAFVPDSFWATLFLRDAPSWARIPANAALGPIVAALTFVCSIGNVPLAAVLWAGGVSFGGVLGFLYADLIVLPLLDVYRRYFGWRMAAYIAGVFFVAMASTAAIVDVAFDSLGLVPARSAGAKTHLAQFSLNYTFWLNLAFGVLAAYLFWVNATHPMRHHGHEPDHDHAHRQGGRHAPENG